MVHQKFGLLLAHLLPILFNHFSFQHPIAVSPDFLTVFWEEEKTRSGSLGSMEMDLGAFTSPTRQLSQGPWQQNRAELRVVDVRPKNLKAWCAAAGGGRCDAVGRVLFCPGPKAPVEISYPKALWYHWKGRDVH